MTNVLFWLYQWQIKGYRRDRMMLYLASLSRQEFVKCYCTCYCTSGCKRPVFTLKMIGIVVTSFALLVIPLMFVPQFNLVWVIISAFGVLLMGPVAVSLSVGLWAIPSYFTEQTLLHLAGRKRSKMSDLIVIGVTGSYGKTSTKEAIADVLSAEFNVLRTPRSANGEIGVAMHTLRCLQPSHQIYVVEMGAYYRGVIASVAAVMKPRIGVFTGLNEQHAGLFGSLENIKKAKLELFDALPSDGVAIVNGADEEIRKITSEIHVRTIVYESRSVAENCEAAICVARELGMSAAQILQGVSKIKPMDKHMVVTPLSDSLTIIDDTYNSNSTGFRSALNALKLLPVEKRIVVTTGIYELGEHAHRVNNALDNEMSNFTDAVFLTEPLHKPFFPHAEVVTDSDQLYRRLQLVSGSVGILFEGRSRVSSEVIALLQLEEKKP